MHIPIKTLGDDDDASMRVVDRDRLFEVLKEREHVLALAGHLHTTEHHDLGVNDGWIGNQPFSLITCGAICGSWWSGPLDIRGIPSTDQRDGSPNGYYTFRFAGNTFERFYKPAGLDPAFQLRVSFPTGILPADSLAGKEFVANVFDGDAHTEVNVKLDDGTFETMHNKVMKDPFIERHIKAQRSSIPSWIEAVNSSHLWALPMPSGLTAGTHIVRVEAKTRNGRVYQAQQIFEVK
jgi:hypothetical protein